MKVGIYYSSISNPAKFPNKTMLMDNFATGVRIAGDEVIGFRNPQEQHYNVDVGFVLGYTMEQNNRRKIIDGLIQNQARPVFVDSNILHYAKKDHEWHRYSLDTVYPDTGTYFFGPKLESRWATYSQWHDVTAKPWRTTGNHVLLLCQRPHGWNMFGKDQDSWINDTINRIQRSTDRPIRIRMHPGDGSRELQIAKLKTRHGSKIVFSTADNIKQDLENCWAAVGYNSTPNVVSAIEGVPVYVDDPVHSWATGAAFTNLAEIENPSMPDRTAWLERIANIHWSNQDVVSGRLWASIRSCISAALR